MIVLPSAKYFSSVPSVAEIATFGTKKSSGTFGAISSAYAATTTGYLTVKWWDGTTVVSGTGNPNITMGFSKSVVSPYNTADEKRFSIYSSDSAGNIIGHITAINFTGYTRSPISYIDHSSLSKLDRFYCDAGPTLTSYKHNGRLSYLALLFTGLTTLDISNGGRLQFLELQYNTSLTSIEGLSSHKSLLYFSGSDSGFTSLDFSGLLNLYHIDLALCTSLTSLRAVDVALFSYSYTSSYYFVGGARLIESGLSAAAMDQFFTDLASADGYINIYCSAGVPSVDASIATNKGYTVIGNVPCI